MRKFLWLSDLLICAFTKFMKLTPLDPEHIIYWMFCPALQVFLVSWNKYLLKNKMIGRLLDWFYGKLSEKESQFNDLSTIPLFKTDIPWFIPKIEDNSALADLDDSVSMNDTKENLWYAETYYTFFYKLLAELVCACDFSSLQDYPSEDHEEEKLEQESTPDIPKDELEHTNEISLSTAENTTEYNREEINDEVQENPQSDPKNESLLDQLSEDKEESKSEEVNKPDVSYFYTPTEPPFELPEEELELLLNPNNQMIVKLLKTWNVYIDTSRNLGMIFAHLSYKNMKFSKRYLAYLGSAIENADCYQIRKWFRIPLTQILQLKDGKEWEELRAIRAMKYLR
jgi:hypothetical protein